MILESSGSLKSCLAVQWSLRSFIDLFYSRPYRSYIRKEALSESRLYLFTCKIILSCLSGRPARNIFYISQNFIVPHFISFNCKLLLNKPSITETKGTIQSLSSDLITSILPHWLIPPLLFFLYIFAIPPGWFGRIRKALHSITTQPLLNRTLQHNTSTFQNLIHNQSTNL